VSEQETGRLRRAVARLMDAQEEAFEPPNGGSSRGGKLPTTWIRRK
jgi:hypothetical protein